MSKFIIRILSVIAVIFTAVPVWAAGGDDGLYSPSYPPGSAFVRFVNGDNTDFSPVMKIRGKTYAAASLGGMGIAYPVSPGEAEITLEKAATVKYDLKPDGHYTALLKDGKLKILEEPSNDNKIKTQIFLINATDTADIKLKTADGKTDVVGPVAPGAISGRAVNPMKIGFSVFAGEEKIADLQERPLERGPGYGVVVYKGRDGKLAVNYDKARGY